MLGQIRAAGSGQSAAGHRIEIDREIDRRVGGLAELRANAPRRSASLRPLSAVSLFCRSKFTHCAPQCWNTTKTDRPACSIAVSSALVSVLIGWW